MRNLAVFTLDCGTNGYLQALETGKSVAAKALSRLTGFESTAIKVERCRIAWDSSLSDNCPRMSRMLATALVPAILHETGPDDQL